VVDCGRFEPVGLSCKLKDRPSIENSQRWASSGVTLAWTKCIKMRDFDILWYIDYYDWSCMNHLGRSRDFRIQNQNESKQNKRCYALLCTSSCSLALPPPNWSSLWMLSSKFLTWIAASTSGFPRHGCLGLRHLWTWWFLDVSGGSDISCFHQHEWQGLHQLRADAIRQNAFEHVLSPIMPALSWGQQITTSYKHEISWNNNRID